MAKVDVTANDFKTAYLERHGDARGWQQIERGATAAAAFRVLAQISDELKANQKRRAVLKTESIQEHAEWMRLANRDTALLKEREEVLAIAFPEGGKRRG